jgi:EPS-associated MarR family transcriptional regulator
LNTHLSCGIRRGAALAAAIWRAVPPCGKEHGLTEETHYKLMRMLEANPGISQRDAARELRISLGKANYCVRALVHKGWIKAAHFKNSRNKAAYMYLLTPRGLEEKAKLTAQFLQLKLREYETLRAEIEQMRAEAARAGPR